MGLWVVLLVLSVRERLPLRVRLQLMEETVAVPHQGIPLLLTKEDLEAVKAKHLVLTQHQVFVERVHQAPVPNKPPLTGMVEVEGVLTQLMFLTGRQGDMPPLEVMAVQV